MSPLRDSLLVTALSGTFPHKTTPLPPISVAHIYNTYCWDAMFSFHTETLQSEKHKKCIPQTKVSSDVNYNANCNVLYIVHITWFNCAIVKISKRLCGPKAKSPQNLETSFELCLVKVSTCLRLGKAVCKEYTSPTSINTILILHLSYLLMTDRVGLKCQ